MAMSDVGEALKWLRERRGWPQKQLAAVAEVTPAMISGYERDRQSPNLNTLEKLLRALGGGLCDLLFAIESLNGRQPVGHDLSPPFRPGQAIPPGPAARKP